MRYLYLTTVYPAYLEQFYLLRPELALASYEEQRAAFDKDAFAWNGAWREPLSRLGHDFMEVSGNLKPMQKAWARENNFRWGASWRKTVSNAQCVAFEPDVLLLDDLRNYSPEWLYSLRKQVPSLQAVIGVMGSPGYDWDRIRACDSILAITRAYESAVNQRGGRAHFFRHAFNSHNTGDISPSGPPAGISFCGNIRRETGYHPAREEFFKDVVTQIPLELFVPQASVGRLKELRVTFARRSVYLGMEFLRLLGVPEGARRGIPLLGKAATWRSMPPTPVDPELRAHMRPPLFGRSMLQKLVDSFATVNVHGNAAGDEAVNMRLYEATGMGTCLLTDWKPSLSELFDDNEVVSFRSSAEFVARAKWLFENPKERDAIAAAGKRRVLREYTFFQRAQDLEEIVAETLAKRRTQRAHRGPKISRTGSSLL